MNTIRRILILALTIGSTLAALASTADSNLCAAQELTRAQRRAQKRQAQSQAKIEWDGKSFLDVTYKQVGKQKLLMDVYLPDGDAAKNLPVIYYVHGGGWASGSKQNFGKALFLPMFEQLSKEGFACVSINYRLCKKGRGVVMRDCVTDAFDGLRFLKKNAQQYSIDTDRIVVFGDSAGGQLAQMLTYASPDKFIGDEDLAKQEVQPIAGISWYGPTDFRDVNLFKTDLSDKDPDRFGARISGGEGGYEQNRAAYEEMSPISWVKKESPPLLMFQGDTDATIPFAHAPRLKEKADRIGADVVMVIVKNAGHNWRKAGGDPDPSLEEIQDATVQYAVRQIKDRAAVNVTPESTPAATPKAAPDTERSEKPSAADIYVSPQGSDKWSGTLPEPNAAGTDGPFASLKHARDVVREIINDNSKDVVVLVREGTYRLKETVVFGVQDSPTGDSTVTYAAFPGETPVFSSGREITGWKEVVDALPGLPEAAIGQVLVADTSEQFFTLYDDEGLLPRARSAGFIPLEGGSKNTLHFPKDKLKNWPNLSDVEIVVRPHHAWISNVLPLASVDEKKQLAETSIDATYAMNELHFLKTTDSCWVENVLEELDEPGEWVLNTEKGKVYLWPRSKTPVLVPQLSELIRVEGNIDKEGPKDKPARNIRFRGLTFMHGERYQLESDDAGLQHDWDMHDKSNALVRLRGTENCTIDNCHFTHSGSGAIRVDLHGQNNKISGNHIEHMGGGGILLCGYGPGTKDVNKNNLVENNHIHHMGRIYLHSPGIFVWQSGENRVANNLIHHMPYCGMIVSGCMTHFFAKKGRELGRTIRRHEIVGLPSKPKLEDVRPYLHTHDNLIEYNEIHHVMETMGDGNGIYIRGAGADNVIRRNYIHHLVAPMQMQAAIRTDGGQRDTLIAENLIYKCMAQGIIIKLNNRAENNIVADVLAPPRGYYLSVREGPLAGASIKRNIFYSTGKDTTFIDELPARNSKKSEDRRGRALARAKDADTDYNIYYCTADPELGKTMLEKQQRDGVDAHSLAVDPQFVDAENGDFRLQPNSPALKLGIVQFDMSKVGLRAAKQ